MSRQIILILTIIIFIISCEKNQDNELKTENSNLKIDSAFQYSKSDNLEENQAEYSRSDDFEANENQFLNSVFRFCPDINKVTCESECACDCCLSEMLFFKNGIYIFISNCEGDESVVKGNYTFHNSKINLISGDTCAIENYNWALETDSNARPNFVTFEKIKRDTSIIEIDNCVGNPILIAKYKNGVDYGYKLKDLTSEKRLKNINDSVKLILNINFH